MAFTTWEQPLKKEARGKIKDGFFNRANLSLVAKIVGLKPFFFL
ncbi:hypothetical protein BGS_1168 [Beggiatoa sp. SS]|nr:hypothetical protein BGS_1168 [Beggiatoa sp. SS]